ncbi:MAG: AAA family ATPase [Candidatus Heimdallarchaeota archaeon]|nr:AAA family ATPase [Candidatus Heimdallarchaeota archaeon]
MNENNAPLVILISGTPGVGKTTIGTLLKKKGYSVIALNDFILFNGLYYGYDHFRGSVILDVEFLKKELRTQIINYSNLLFIEGHTTEYVPKQLVSLIFVIKCNPRILRKRLIARGYLKRKIEENIQAEIMEECLLRHRENFPEKIIIELDSSDIKPEEIVNEIMKSIDNIS